MLAALATGLAGFASLGTLALASPSAHAAPGNNGTVKVDNYIADDSVANVPQTTCGFSVQWFGFDAGTVDTDVSFSAWAPTTSADFTINPGALHTSFTGGGGGSTLNHTQGFTVQAAAGTTDIHVKVTVSTTSSKGADSKYKVLWIHGCAPTPTTSAPPPPPTTAAAAPPPPPAAAHPPTVHGPGVPAKVKQPHPQPPARVTVPAQPAVPTTVHAGLATGLLPVSATTDDRGSTGATWSRWPLLMISGASALLGMLGLLSARSRRTGG